MPNPIVHFEIGCRDHAAMCSFYSKLFGWNVSPESPFHFPGGAPGAGGGEGIGGHLNCLGHEPHNYVTVYAQVDDLDQHLKKVKQLGGKVLIPPTEVPQTGHFAWFTDPEGNTVGLWKPMAG